MQRLDRALGRCSGREIHEAEVGRFLGTFAVLPSDDSSPKNISEGAEELVEVDFFTEEGQVSNEYGMYS